MPPWELVPTRYAASVDAAHHHATPVDEQALEGSYGTETT
jgi:hypothetical protein